MKVFRESQSFPIIGGSSLLVTFAVLCLTVFALLSFSTVRADQRLADANVQAVSDYYRADCQAEEILARLRSGQIPPGVRQESGLYCYECTISPTQSLQVTVRSSDWQILRWQAVPTTQWEPDESLDLWTGQP